MDVYVNPEAVWAESTAGMARHAGKPGPRQHRMVFFERSDGVTEFCDEGVLPLVRVLNRIPLVMTWASCEGYADTYWGGYVSFLWAGSKRDLRSLLREMSQACPLLRNFRIDRLARIPKKYQVGRFRGLPETRGYLDFPAGAAKAIAVALAPLSKGFTQTRRAV